MTVVNEKRRQFRQRELSSFAQTFDMGGIVVFVNCFWVQHGGRPRFEVTLRGHGEAAVIDVPDHDEGVLPRRISDAVLAFSETIRLGVAA